LCYFCRSPETLDGQVRQTFKDHTGTNRSRRSCNVKAAS
jgi:hypothetical protein